MLLELSRYLLRAIAAHPTGIRVEHVQSGGVAFLFLEVPKADKQRLSERDREALTLVLERIGKKLGHEVIVDWR
ncbi:MAG: hypothetical protein ACK42E_01360 [Candidatus Bipolaricaulaceae bacterium]